METPLFFKNQTYNLYGVLHQPEENSSTLAVSDCYSKGIGLVFCYPFAEEKLISHRSIVSLARALTKNGIYCLRFDYMGHGDSEGDFEDSTIESRISDIHCAVNHMKNHTGIKKVGLIGFRIGATLALLACGNSDISYLILIAPVIRGKTYIENCLRSNLTTQIAANKKITQNRNELISDLLANKTVNIDGYLLTKPLYLQMADINLLDHPLKLSDHNLLLQVAKKRNQPYEKDLNLLYQKYKNTGISLELQSVCDSIFWAEAIKYNPTCTVIQGTITDWFNSSLDSSKEHTA